MVDTQNFRLAFHGFNRDDVLQFLEAEQAKHTMEVNSLKDDVMRLEASLISAQMAAQPAPSPQLESLQTENATLHEQLESLQAENATLHEQLEPLQTENATLHEQLEPLQVENATLHEQLEPLQAENATLHEQLEPLQAENAALREQLEELETRPTPEAPPAVEASDSNLRDQELEAYRRAENVERQARIRAGQMSAQVHTLVDDISNRMDGTQAEMTAAADELGQALERLQAALDHSRAALQDGAAAFRALQPEPEQD